jgi:hypothetical protein
MPSEPEDPAEHGDPDPAGPPPGSDVVFDDPGPIEIDFLMKGAAPEFDDLLAGWDVQAGDDQDDPAQ